MAEYTEAFAAFILEAREAFRDLERRIDRGEVPAGKAVTLKITIPPLVVDHIRQDRLVEAGRNGDG